MTDYKLEILSAAFVATGVATQAKGYLYRLQPDKGRKQETRDTMLSDLPGLKVATKTPTGERALSVAEERWSGTEDYWLGRSALTSLVVKHPEGGVLLLEDVTMNVSLQKEIVRTTLVGRRGTIKEYITDGDYQVSMSIGVAAVDENHELIDQYPERALAELRKVLDTEEAVEISSGFLDVFGIRKLVVTGYTVKQMTYANRQVVEVTAVSDEDYVIESTDY